MSEQPTWWGNCPVPISERRFWRIGPALLGLSRDGQEWVIERQLVSDPMDATCVVASSDVPVEWQEGGESKGRRRLASSSALRMLPATADRAVVSRPVERFVLPSGASAITFVGTPLWLQFFTDASTSPIIDEPIVSPKQTWLGPTDDRGELCYTSRTQLHRNSSDLSPRPQRCRSRLHVINRSSLPLEIDRLKIPVQYLSLYAEPSDGGARLWTEDIELVATAGNEFAEVSIAEGPPREIDGGELVASAREPQPKGFIVRAFGGLGIARMLGGDA